MCINMPSFSDSQTISATVVDVNPTDELLCLVRTRDDETGSVGFERGDHRSFPSSLVVLFFSILVAISLKNSEKYVKKKKNAPLDKVDNRTKSKKI